MTASSGRIVALVTHARSVPALERGRFATRLHRLRGSGAIAIETCHRVEAYAIASDDPAGIADAVGLPAGGRVLVGDDAIRHVIAVAVGTDSVVIGEDQILHQLRAAVAAVRSDGGLHAELERLFGLALHAGRRARSWRQGPQRSLADLALEVVERRTGSLRGRELLVVGAGSMGRLTALAGVRAGASVSIANRSSDRARGLSTATGARTVPFDPGSQARSFAGVVVALGGPWPIGPATIEALAEPGTVVVDLSVPPAMPEAAVMALGTRLVSADALAQADVDPFDALSGAAASGSRLDELVAQTTAEFVGWQRARDGRTAAEALVRRAELEREAELEQLWRRHPELQPELREAIERMTESFAKRLLREPLERLGRDTDGHNERAARELFAV
ncbi:MAG: NAD(P)-binding domain-containing protein [Candidatus Limnocylindrales bacterium]